MLFSKPLHSNPCERLRIKLFIGQIQEDIYGNISSSLTESSKCRWLFPNVEIFSKRRPICHYDWSKLYKLRVKKKKKRSIYLLFLYFFPSNLTSWEAYVTICKKKKKKKKELSVIPCHRDYIILLNISKRRYKCFLQPQWTGNSVLSTGWVFVWVGFIVKKIFTITLNV